MSKSSLDCPDSPLEEEPLSMSEQKFNIDHAIEHPFVNIIEPCEATNTINGNNGRFGKESILDASKNSEDINARNGDFLASEATKEIRNRNRSSSKKDSLYASRPSEAPTDIPNVVRFHLDEQPCPYNSEHPEAKKKVEINSSYRRREDAAVQAVYKKRNKLPKDSGKCPGNRPSNGRTDHPRQENDEDASTGGAVAVVKSKVHAIYYFFSLHLFLNTWTRKTRVKLIFLVFFFFNCICTYFRNPVVVSLYNSDP